MHRADYASLYRRRINLHEVGGHGSLHDYQLLVLANELLEEYAHQRGCVLPRLGPAPYFRTQRFAFSLYQPVPFDSFVDLGVAVKSATGATLHFQVAAFRAGDETPCFAGEIEWEQVDAESNPVPLTPAQRDCLEE